jgi:hypothetical protein
VRRARRENGKEKLENEESGSVRRTGSMVPILWRRPGYPACFLEECENKGLIFARVKKILEVIENKGRKNCNFLDFLKKSKRVGSQAGILG